MGEGGGVPIIFSSTHTRCPLAPFGMTSIPCEGPMGRVSSKGSLDGAATTAALEADATGDVDAPGEVDATGEVDASGEVDADADVATVADGSAAGVEAGTESGGGVALVVDVVAATFAIVVGAASATTTGSGVVARNRRKATTPAATHRTEMPISNPALLLRGRGATASATELTAGRVGGGV